MDNCYNLIEENNQLIIEDTSPDIVYYNILEEITTKGTKVITTTLNNALNIPHDGWFKLKRIGIPTQIEKSYKSNNYVFIEGKIYKVRGEELEKTNILELLEINPSTTNLVYAEEEFFNTNYLESCMLKLNNLPLNQCSNKSDPCSPNNCKRNHIWHIVNMLKYYIHCSDIYKAQNLLEMFNQCFSWCSSNGSCHCFNKCKCQ